MIEQEFRALVALKTSWGVHLNRAIENEQPPYIVVSKVSGPRGYTNDGADGTVVARFQVDLYANDYKTVKEQTAMLISGTTDYSSSRVHYLTLENETDLYDDASKLHHIVLDYFIRYYE